MSDESREPFKRLFFALNCAPEQRRAIAQWRNALGLNIGRPVPAEKLSSDAAVSRHGGDGADSGRLRGRCQCPDAWRAVGGCA